MLHYINKQLLTVSLRKIVIGILLKLKGHLGMDIDNLRFDLDTLQIFHSGSMESQKGAQFIPIFPNINLVMGPNLLQPQSNKRTRSSLGTLSRHNLQFCFHGQKAIMALGHARSGQEM